MVIIGTIIRASREVNGFKPSLTPLFQGTMNLHTINIIQPNKIIMISLTAVLVSASMAIETERIEWNRCGYLVTILLEPLRKNSRRTSVITGLWYGFKVSALAP
jgi:hypothetical protein